MGKIRDTPEGITNDEGWSVVSYSPGVADFIHTGCGAKTSALITPTTEQGIYCPNCDKYFVMEWSDDGTEEGDSFLVVRERQAGDP